MDANNADGATGATNPLIRACLNRGNLKHALQTYVCRDAVSHNLFRDNGTRLHLCNRAAKCPTPGCHEEFISNMPMLKTHIKSCVKKHYGFDIDFQRGKSGRRRKVRSRTPEALYRVDWELHQAQEVREY
jgi:hypothetical protein